MGKYYDDAKVDIGLLGLTVAARDRIKEFLANEKKVQRISDPMDARDTKSMIDNKLINALVIDIFSYGTEAAISLIKDLRETDKYRHVPIALAGSEVEIRSMKRVPTETAFKYEHYYKYYTDIADDDLLKEHLGILVDCMVADAVKVHALQAYLTTPGKYATFNFKLRRFLQKENVQAALIGSTISGLALLAVELIKRCP